MGLFIMPPKNQFDGLSSLAEPAYRIDGSSCWCVHDNDAGAGVKHSLGQVGADIAASRCNAIQVGLPVSVWSCIQPAMQHEQDEEVWGGLNAPLHLAARDMQ